MNGDLNMIYYYIIYAIIALILTFIITLVLELEATNIVATLITICCLAFVVIFFIENWKLFIIYTCFLFILTIIKRFINNRKK